MDNLSGSIERITYYNPENGYTVLRLRPEGRKEQRVPGLSFTGLVTQFLFEDKQLTSPVWSPEQPN